MNLHKGWSNLANFYWKNRYVQSQEAGDGYPNEEWFYTRHGHSLDVDNPLKAWFYTRGGQSETTICGSYMISKNGVLKRQASVHFYWHGGALENNGGK